LVREKYFSLHPKPLERWLWQQRLPQAAERVFWLHWEEGMKRGDWCSELSLRQVARECCVDTSTVTRAYQVLRNRSLIRREDPGRDPSNPFQQAVAITEVRLPRELLVEMGRAPNRPTPRQTAAEPRGATIEANPSRVEHKLPESVQEAPREPAAPLTVPSRGESAALLKKLSDSERTQFFVSSRDRLDSMKFDARSTLSTAEQARVLALLQQVSAERPRETPRAMAIAPLTKCFARVRQLSPLDAARLRKSVLALVPANSGTEVFRQVLWSVEEGALRRFEPRLAANIALKKIREGAWTRPNRMPPNWLRGAVPETCNAA
jgi:hypothetical protein